MKYIKLFENYFENIEVGDYIKSSYQLGDKGDEFKIIKKIPLVKTGPISPAFSYSLINMYGIEATCNNRDISRKLKPKEIEKFELELATNKYNV